MFACCEAIGLIKECREKIKSLLTQLLQICCSETPV